MNLTSALGEVRTLYRLGRLNQNPSFINTMAAADNHHFLPHALRPISLINSLVLRVAVLVGHANAARYA